MKKPGNTTIIKAYDYNKVIDYIEDKYGIYTRDMCGKFHGENPNPDNPYVDFWHFVCDTAEIVNNDCIAFLPMDKTTLKLAGAKHPKLLEVFELLFKEFPELKENEGADFWFSW